MSATKKAKDEASTNLDDLLEKNPRVDGAQVREARELLKELREGGVGAPSYGIVSPYERRSVRAAE
jgi:hypothetical protein